MNEATDPYVVLATLVGLVIGWAIGNIAFDALTALVHRRDRRKKGRTN